MIKNYISRIFKYLLKYIFLYLKISRRCYHYCNACTSYVERSQKLGSIMRRNRQLTKLIIILSTLFYERDSLIMSARCRSRVIFSFAVGKLSSSYMRSSISELFLAMLPVTSLKSSQGSISNYIVIHFTYICVCTWFAITVSIKFRGCLIPRWTIVVCFGTFEFYHFQLSYAAAYLDMFILVGNFNLKIFSIQQFY